MTGYKKFRKTFEKFLQESKVNLGRKDTKTKQAFINEAMLLLDGFLDKEAEETQPTTARNMDDRVLRIKPTDKRRALDMGKGVHSMTPSESMRADEQLNRSPYGDRAEGGDE